MLLLGCDLSLRVTHVGNLILWVDMWRALQHLGGGYYCQVIRSLESVSSRMDECNFHGSLVGFHVSVV